MYSIAQHVLIFSPIRDVIVYYQYLLRRAICAELVSLQVIEKYLSKSEISALSVKARENDT